MLFWKRNTFRWGCKSNGFRCRIRPNGGNLMSQYGVQLKSTEDVFYELCRQNPDLRLERTAEGEVIVMPPTGGETGNQNNRISGQLFNWSEHSSQGESFDSSTGFKLDNSAIR